MYHDVPQPTTATTSPGCGSIRANSGDCSTAASQQSGWLAISSSTKVMHPSSGRRLAVLLGGRTTRRAKLLIRLRYCASSSEATASRRVSHRLVWDHWEEPVSKHERLGAILELLNRDGTLDVDEAAAELRVSAATIRRDLDILAQQQLLTRTH